MAFSSPSDAGSVLTRDEVEILHKAIEKTILYFLEHFQPIYLENFGILLPVVETTEINSLTDETMHISKQQYLTAEFEKCYEITNYHREKFRNIAEAKAILDEVKKYIPKAFASKLGENGLKSGIKNTFKTIKDEVSVASISKHFPLVGLFLALHNRQGNNPGDWFAGSDIFLLPNFKKQLSSEPLNILDRPVLFNAFEPFEAMFGKEAATFNVNLEEELGSLGFETKNLKNELGSDRVSFQVKVFVSGIEGNEPTALHYVTEGLRNVAKNNEGNELVVTLPVELRNSKDDIPSWPLRMLTLGWILIQSSSKGSIKDGIALSARESLIKGSDSDLSAILTTNTERLSVLFKTTTNYFTYKTVVGITADELELFNLYGAQILTSLLSRKGLLKNTRPTRSSVLKKTGYLLPEIINLQ